MRLCCDPFFRSFHRLTSRASVSLLLMAASVAAQTESWQASPYRVRIWYRCSTDPEAAAWEDRLKEPLGNRIREAFGADWRVVVEPMPPEVPDPERPVSETRWGRLHSGTSPPFDAEKLFVVRVEAAAAALRVVVREFDLLTRELGPRFERLCPQEERMPGVAVELIDRAFVPLARVTRVKGNRCELALRAAFLEASHQPDRLPPPGSLFEVRLRRLDRSGQLLPDGVETIPWTVLRLTAIKDGRASCDVVSGLRGALRARVGQPLQRLAYPIRVLEPASNLRLVSALDPRKPLVGYEVFAKASGDPPFVRLGETNDQGSIRLVANPHEPLGEFTIRNGRRRLARLPIVVGARPEYIAPLSDDDPRLDAEGFLRGVQEEIIDTVARRRILFARIRAALDRSAADEAKRLLDEARDLKSRDDFLRLLRDRRRDFVSEDRNVAALIEQLFANTEEVLLKHLGREELDAIEVEVRQADGGR